MILGMKNAPISVRFEDDDEEAMKAAAKLEGIKPGVYIGSAAVRYTREKYPQVFKKPAEKND